MFNILNKRNTSFKKKIPPNSGFFANKTTT